MVFVTFVITDLLKYLIGKSFSMVRNSVIPHVPVNRLNCNLICEKNKVKDPCSLIHSSCNVLWSINSVVSTAFCTFSLPCSCKLHTVSCHLLDVIDAFCPWTSSFWYYQCLLPWTSSAWCYQCLLPWTSSVWCYQCLLPWTFSAWCWQSLLPLDFLCLMLSMPSALRLPLFDVIDAFCPSTSSVWCYRCLLPFDFLCLMLSMPSALRLPLFDVIDAFCLGFSQPLETSSLTWSLFFFNELCISLCVHG